MISICYTYKYVPILGLQGDMEWVLFLYMCVYGEILEEVDGYRQWEIDQNIFPCDHQLSESNWSSHMEILEEKE